MLYDEFEKLIGFDVDYSVYEAWNAAYTASNLDKFQFCKIVKKAVKTKVKKPLLYAVKYCHLDACRNGGYNWAIFEFVDFVISTGKIIVKKIEDVKIIDPDDIQGMFYVCFPDYFEIQQ